MYMIRHYNPFVNYYIGVTGLYVKYVGGHFFPNFGILHTTILNVSEVVDFI